MALGALAYELDGDIYVADWDGSNPVRIADGRPPENCIPDSFGEYWVEGSIWSPDGRYLAFRHATCRGDEEIWPGVVISDPEGNVVTSFPGEGWLISWSPDSTHVAVWVRWGETIGVYGLDGVRQALLTVPPGMMAPGDFDPVWSRDGESLLLPHGVEVPIDGRTPRQLPSSDPRVFDATYSPDGSRVAYTFNGSLIVAAADGSDPQRVSEAGMDVWNHPVWSPTSDRIAFTSANAHELRVLDVATGTVTLLAETDGPFLAVRDFSPEDNFILFVRWEERGAGVSWLWSIHADGSDTDRLVAGTQWGDWQSVSPTH